MMSMIAAKASEWWTKKRKGNIPVIMRYYVSHYSCIVLIFFVNIGGLKIIRSKNTILPKSGLYCSWSFTLKLKFPGNF